MLKQDVLDCVHSKARWYAVHQTKKVCFRLNPHLNGTEDLLGAVNELQYTPDYTATRRLESDVYGENYGRRYPSFTIHEMKEYKFWPFVAGESWRKCTSLRITPGSLLTSLVEAYRDMEKDEKILRYTTDVYEKAVTYKKTKACLKNYSPRISSILSSNSSTTEEKVDASNTIDMMKISFTHYGVSVSHLKKVMNAYGIDNITDDEIARQNPGVAAADFSTPRGVPCLKDLVERKSALHLVASSIRLELGPIASDDQFEITDQQRHASKKKFTQGQVCWETKYMAPHKECNQLHAILNPMNRRILLDRKHEMRLRRKRRIELHECLSKAIQKTNNAYEKWWLLQKEDPLMTTGSLFGYTNLSYFGNSWIIDENFSSEVENLLKSNHTSGDDSRKSLPSHIVHSPRLSRPPLYVPNIGEVDCWRCECDVCTGNLLHRVVGIGGVTTRTQGQEGRITNKQLRMIKKNEHDLKEQNPVEKRATVISKLEVHRPSTDKKSATRKKSRGARRTKRKKSTEKLKIDPKIWWESVSSYTTPKWKTMKDSSRREVNSEIQFKPNKGELAHKLKFTYSFEKLRHLRPSIAQNNKFLKNGDRSPFIAKPQKDIDGEDFSPSDNDSQERLNMDVLLAHNIVYKRRPSEDRSRLKINLPSLTPESADNLYCRKDNSHRARIASDKASMSSVANGKHRDEFYFLHCVPENFAELCFAGLSEYIVRFEVVLTGNGFHRVESMTINRKPLCSYGEREDKKHSGEDATNIIS